MDAGNIWDISGSDFIDQDAKLDSLSSLEDIAIGSGFGLRYDLSFFVLRLDIGFKTYEPYLKNDKWFKNYNFESAEYNIGINILFSKISYNSITFSLFSVFFKLKNT